MIPATLQANPELHRWVGFETPGEARVCFGKIEIGQGAMTALAQIAAEELDVSMARLRVTAGDTDLAPDEGMTVGSMSIESSGASLRAVCAEVRALFLAAAAERLGRKAGALSIEDGTVVCDGEPTGEDYWTLAPHVDLARPATGEAEPKAVGDHRLVGTSQPRLDLPAKVFGGGFIQDMTLPGMRHARVLRQPGPAATLAAFDEAAVARAAGGAVEFLREGQIVAMIGDDETVVNRAAAAAPAHAVWENAREIEPKRSEPASLREAPNHEFRRGEPSPGPSNLRRHTAAYSRPYLSHGSLAPSCGLAEYRDGHLTVWSHTQGVYPLRGIIARALGLSLDAVTVKHAQGAGCYGHNGADDAAFDAAFIAFKRPETPIRVQWRREDEFGHAPVGPAMLIEMSAELDASGQPVDWTSEIWSGAHVSRGRLLAESALPGAVPADPANHPAVMGLPRFSGGRLNAVPSYDFPTARVVEHLIVETPVRTSSLRGLGGPVNTYAGECMIDELAEIAGQDPLAYRLAILSNPRGRAVMEKAAAMADWGRRGPAGSGRGLGMGFDHHRDSGGWCAAVAEVEVDEEVRVTKVWCAADCGLIINPDGAKNQLEGGIVMAVSWALKERVRLEGEGVASVTWGDYPILRFDEVPEVEVALIDAPNERPLGLGEISSGPALAAVGNAVAHALGARIRDMPFTREQIARTILAG